MTTTSAPRASRIRGNLTDTSRLSSALSYVVLVSGLLTIVVTIYMVVSSYSSLPFWDGWEEFRFAANGDSLLSPASLWRLHNEHRIVIPKLFLVADMRLFHARQEFLLASILVIQFLHVALLSWSMRVLGGWSGALWRTGTGLAGFCLFCPSQHENFIWAFQVDFVLPHFFATLSLVALVLYWTEAQRRPEKQASAKFLLVSVLAALGGSLSLASGNLIWPLLVAGAVYLRLPLRAVLSFATAGVVCIAVYLNHYVQPEGHGNPLTSLGAPFKLLHYCSAYFLSSWPLYDNRQILAFWLVLFASGVPVLYYLRNARPFAIQMALIILYCLATAFITATGRMNFGISQAASSRYQTVALLFWCCLGLLWLGGMFLARLRMRHAFLIAQMFLLAVFARGERRASDQIEIAQGHAFNQKAAMAALLTEVPDPASVGESYPLDVYPEKDLWDRIVPYLGAHHLSVFSDSLAVAVGKPLTTMFPVADSSECSGAVETAVPVENSYGAGLRMLGKAWDRTLRRLPSSVLVTSNGTIVGLGATGRWQPYAHADNPGLPSRNDGFVAYTPELPGGSVVSLYAILHRSPASACYIGQIAR